MTERLEHAAGPAAVVGLGTVDPALVAAPLRVCATFVASPRPEDPAALADLAWTPTPHPDARLADREAR